jgi:hypothetical protein
MDSDYKRKLVATATRSGQHGDIWEVARDIFSAGIDPSSQEMTDRIRAAFPTADQHEIEAAVEYVTYYVKHMRRHDKPDGHCWWCEQPANQHHPEGPIVNMVDTPDEDDPPYEFCSWNCLAHWLAECGGGDFVVERGHTTAHQNPEQYSQRTPLVNRMKELVVIATRARRHVSITKTAYDAIDSGIDPTSQEMIDYIQDEYPDATQHELEAVAEFAAKREEYFQRLPETDSNGDLS